MLSRTQTPHSSAFFSKILKVGRNVNLAVVYTSQFHSREMNGYMHLMTPFLVVASVKQARSTRNARMSPKRHMLS